MQNAVKKLLSVFTSNNPVQKVSEITQKNKQSIESLAEDISKFKV